MSCKWNSYDIYKYITKNNMSIDQPCCPSINSRPPGTYIAPSITNLNFISDLFPGDSRSSCAISNSCSFLTYYSGLLGQSTTISMLPIHQTSHSVNLSSENSVTSAFIVIDSSPTSMCAAHIYNHCTCMCECLRYYNNLHLVRAH